MMLYNFPDTSGMDDHETAQCLFNHLGIETKDKSNFELMDELDRLLKFNLKLYFQIHGPNADVEAFALETDTRIVGILLNHLTMIHRWIEK